MKFLWVGKYLKSFFCTADDGRVVVRLPGNKIEYKKINLSLV